MSGPKSYGLGLGWPMGAGQPVVDGFVVPQLPIWSAAVRNVLAGSGDALGLFVGDSTTAGVGNGNVSGSLANNARGKNPATVTASLLSAVTQASPATVYGGSRLTTAAMYNGYDNRATFTGTWTVAASGATIGGGYFNAAAAATMTYDLGLACDRLTLGMWETLSGVFDVIVNGATVATVTTTTAAIQTVTLPSGTTSVTLSWVSGQIRVYMLDGRNTTTKRIYTASAGQPGQKLSDYAATTTSHDTKNVITARAPSLVILDSWINEAGAAQDQTTYKATFQGFINVAKAAGSDVLLIGGHITGAGGSAATRAPYMTSLAELSALNSVPFLNLALSTPQWATFVAASAAGYMDPDGTHLTEAGAAAKAAVIYDWLTP